MFFLREKLHNFQYFVFCFSSCFDDNLHKISVYTHSLLTLLNSVLAILSAIGLKHVAVLKFGETIAEMSSNPDPYLALCLTKLPITNSYL